MTLSDRIENLIGSYPYGVRMEEALNTACRLVIGELPEALLMSFAVEETDDGTTGVDVTNKRIVKAHKSGYPASRIDETTRARLITETTGRPGFYILGNTAHVVPGGGTIITVSFPAVSRKAITITGFPTMLVDLVVERAALLLIDSMMVDVRDGFGTAVTLPTAPSAPAAPSITYSAASAAAVTPVTIAALPTAPVYTPPTLATKPAVPTVGTLDLTLKVDGATALTPPVAPSAPTFTFSDATAATVGTITIGALPAPPTYTAASFGGSLTLPTLPTLDLSTEDDGVTALAPPTAPAAPSIAFVDATAATVAASTLAALSTAPAYTKPTFAGSLTLPTLPTLDLTTKIDGATAKTVPTAPSTPSFAYVDASAAAAAATTVGALGTAPTYTKPSFGGSIGDITSALPASLNLATELDGVTALAVPTAPAAPSLSSAGQASVTVDFTAADAAAPAYTKPTTASTLSFTNWTTYFTDEDPEIMAETMRKASVELDEIKTKVQDEANEFQKEVEIYRAKVQKAIEDARIGAQEAANELRATDEMALQDYAQELQRYDRQLAEYEANVGNQVQQFRLNIERAITGIATAQRLFLEQYQHDIQNETTEFQKELAVYQQDAQHKIEQARTTLQEALANARASTDVSIQNEIRTFEAQVQEYQSSLTRYEAQLREYSADTEAQVESYRAAFQNAFATWTQQQGLYLQQYAQDIENETAEFQKELAAYQQDAQHKIEQVRTTMQEALANARMSTDVSVQNEIKTMEAAVADYDRELARYDRQLVQYQAEVERQVQTFTLSLEKAVAPWREQQRAYLEKYARDIQAAGDEYSGAMQDHLREADRLMEQARIDAQRVGQQAQLTTDVAVQNELQTIRAAIEQYANELQLHTLKQKLYEMEIQAVIQKYSIVLESNIRLFEAEGALDTQRYSVQVANARAAFDQSLAVYQSGIERNALQAQITRQEAQQTAAQATEIAVVNAAKAMEALATDYQMVLRKHENDMANYKSQVDSALNKQRTLTESVSAKLRMMNFDRQRQEERYRRSFSSFMRAHWPQRTFTVQQPVI